MPLFMSPIERAALSLGLVPPPIVDFAHYASYRFLIVAQRLGVFDALVSSPLTLPELAHQLAASEAPLRNVLDAVRLTGYVTERKGRYALTPIAQRYVTTTSRQSVTGAMDMLAGIAGRLDHLEESIRTGKPPYTAYEHFNDHPDQWSSFHTGQKILASFAADEVARKTQVSERARRLIDLGGSHALYSIALCQRYSRLSALIYDWPEGVSAARMGIAATGLESRITTQTGDFLTDDIGTGFDVAFLGNIIHGQPPHAVQALLTKVHDALSPGGQIVVLDQIRLPNRLTRFAAFSAVMTGLILFNELGGALYPYEQVSDWLQTAGFAAPSVRRIRRSPGTSLIQARRR